MALSRNCLMAEIYIEIKNNNVYKKNKKEEMSRRSKSKILILKSIQSYNDLSLQCIDIVPTILH